MKTSQFAFAIAVSVLLSSCQDEQFAQKLLDAEKQIVQLQRTLADTQAGLAQAKKNFPALQVEIVPLFNQAETLKFEQNPNDEFVRRETEVAVYVSTAKTQIAWLDMLLNHALVQYYLSHDDQTTHAQDDVSDEALQQFFTRLYQTFQQTAKEDRPIGYTTSADTYYVGQRNKLVSFIQTFEHYSGGAHGIYHHQHLNIDIEKQKVIVLDDLIRPGHQPRVADLLWQAYQASLVQENGESDEAFIERSDFFVPDNFYFSGAGIHFVYPLYSLAPYVAGEVELFVRYEELKSLINADYFPTEKDGFRFNDNSP
ncbi:MAG: RsiV family protein [Pasteurellaceae bacterium]|nr:RsiV family protein [Pasteurellaceae bacterium]